MNSSRRLGLYLRRLTGGRRRLPAWLPSATLERLVRRWVDVSAPFHEASDQGQMMPKERALVRETVLRARPRICVELGTWRGGGSTYQIASALAQNGDGGLLYTYEPDPECLQAAVDNYRREAPHLLPYIRFHRDDFLAGIERGDLDRIDFALLDGPDDAEYTRTVLQALTTRLAPGAFVVLHDWHVEKCRLVRDYVAASDRWVVDTVHADTPTGLARLHLRAS
jgi:predicted O-methyltransferase YrrM